jgi:hypothetical protein
MTRKEDYLSAAPFSQSMTQWKAQMVSKQVGDLRLTLYETEQELQSIYQNLDPEVPRMVKASLRVVLYHLGESTRSLMKLSEEVASTKMEQ